MSDIFWLKDPKILVDMEQFKEFWPAKKLSMARKLNAISRSVIIISLLAFLYKRNLKVIFSALATLGVIVILYKADKKNDKKKEAFDNPIKQNYYNVHRAEYQNPQEKNPFMNVLLTDCPDRKEALPSYEKDVEEDIYEVVKNNKFLSNDPKLFCDLGDNMQFEQSMRQFYTTANTKTPNDQKAFAMWLYGNMPSCKDDTIQCLKNAPGAINPTP
jgi:hypothetical protein